MLPWVQIAWTSWTNSRQLSPPFSFSGISGSCAVPVNVVNGESKTHVFVGWLSGQKNCFDEVELFNMVSERGPIVAQDNGQRYCNFPVLFYPIVNVDTILGPQSLSPGLARFVPMRNLQLVGLESVAVLRFVGRHFIAVGTKGRRGTFSSAATATATTAAAAAVLGHGREEVGVLFHDEIELLALGFKFRV
jgi:hypothetical protein